MKRGVDGKEVNLPQLLLHASAFGLYILSAVMFEIVNLMGFHKILDRNMNDFLKDDRILTHITLPIA